MLAKGYVAASVGEICEKAGVTRGTLFHYFKNKEDLGKVLLKRFAERQGEAFGAACDGIENPLDRVYAVIDFAIEGARSPEMKGCLVGTFAQEIAETHPDLAEICRCSFARVAEAVGADLEAAKEAEAPDAAFDARALGDYFVSLAQGSMLLVKTGGARELMAANLVHFKSYLKTLYGR